ncbi:MAG: radical SAM protein [Deltaproteobacteria bacterium]|nr:radical SAM protein [Deltaproteobacteria bacterium]
MKNKYNFPVIYIDGTRKCNLNCPLCMTGSNNPSIVDEHAHNELTYDEIVEKILIPGKDLGANQIQLGGGEFLIRPDALEIIRTSIKLNYEIRLLTNGKILDEKMILKLKEIAERKIVLVFGVNSLEDIEMNNWTRDTQQNHFRHLIELCSKFKVRKHVVVTVSKENLACLDNTLQWLDDHRISFNRSPFIGRMSGKEFFKDYAFSKEDMEKVIHPSLVNKISGYFSYTPFFLSPEVHAEISGGKSYNSTVPQNPHIGCWIGSWIAIGSEGNVSPCTTMLDEVIAGNIRNQSLFDIIDKSKVFNDLLNRDEVKGKCGKCRYKRTCNGCRSLAYYHTGDYMQEDPTCFFKPKDESTVSEFEEITNKIFRKYARLARRVGLAKKVV